MCTNERVQTIFLNALILILIYLERVGLEECIAEEVGQGMKAHLNTDRNDTVEGMREGQ